MVNVASRCVCEEPHRDIEVSPSRENSQLLSINCRRSKIPAGVIRWPRILGPALILVFIVAVCTVLALDASVTPEQRIATYQQSGIFP